MVKIHKTCFATGNFFPAQLFKTINDNISYLEGFSFDGFEITFAQSSEVEEFILSKEIKEKLQKSSHLSLHLPFHFTYDKNKETRLLIKRIQKLIDDLDVVTVVMHQDNIKDPYYLKFLKVQLCIENLPPKYKLTLQDYSKFLEENPNYKIVIDTTHALAHSPEHLSELLEHFAHKIQYFHVSEFAEEKQHLPLYTKHYDVWNKVRDYPVPKIIEVKYKNLEDFQRDYEFISVEKIDGSCHLVNK